MGGDEAKSRILTSAKCSAASPQTCWVAVSIISLGASVVATCRLWSIGGPSQQIVGAIDSPRPLESAVDELLRMPLLLKVIGIGGERFRVQACDADQQISASRWETFSVGDRRVMNWLEISEDRHLRDEEQPQVACLVYSHRRNRQLLRDSFALWGQDCDSFLPFSDETWTDADAGFQTIEVHPDTGPDNYFHIISKMRKALGEVARRVEAGNLTFDLLVISTDDAFWILSSLRKYLRTAPKRGVGFYAGHRFVQNGNALELYASGGGYVINKPALQAYLACPLTQMPGFAEDLIMGRCLRQAGVAVSTSEDVQGRQRFHFAGPKEVEELNYSAPSDPRAQWIRDFHKPWLSTMRMGLEGISRDTVMFHAVSGQRRYDMHDWLYRRRTCGPQDPLVVSRAAIGGDTLQVSNLNGSGLIR